MSVVTHPYLSMSCVSFDPKMAKKCFSEDNYVIYRFVQNFNEIKDYIRIHSITLTPFELRPINRWSLQGHMISINSISHEHYGHGYLFCSG